MRPLCYSINVTTDGCVDHRAGIPDAELHRYWAERVARADAMVLGRVTYQMMEEAWRRPPSGEWPEWMDDSDIAFAENIDTVPKDRKSVV